MTRKSANRLAKDAIKAQNQEKLDNNNCWDDLNGIFTSCRNLLVQHGALAHVANNRELMAEVTNLNDLSEHFKSLARDIKQLTAELSQIYQEHQGKTGGSKNPDEVLNTCVIAEHYNLFMVKHDSVVMPTVNCIMEHISQAEKALFEKQQALNVNVVTDVEVKEVTPSTHNETVAQE